MTIDTLFLVLIPTYLALIAYGVVAARRRRTSGRLRAITTSLIVLIPPTAILGALYSTGDAFLIAGWGVVTLALLAAGIVTALLTTVLARRIAP